MNKQHIIFMKRALWLAKKGAGLVSPNPPVGCCIVKDNIIIGEGYHKVFGGAHAEVNALRNLSSQDLVGATLYVTLEPCSHYGKTPPCTELIINKGIKNVVIGVLDKNPLVSGKGVKRLEDNGIKVTYGILEKELNDFYKPFFKYIRENKPFVTLKVASSLDGKNGVAGTKYLVSEKTLNYVHKLRYFSDAIMIGVNTLNNDDPELNIRHYSKSKPLTKVVLDYYGKSMGDAKIFRGKDKVLIYTVEGNFSDILSKENIEIVRATGENGYLNINDVLIDLGKRGILNLLVEGGGTLSFSLLKENLVDRLILILTPYIIGGVKNIAFAGSGFANINDVLKLDGYTIKKLDKDLILMKDFC